MADIDEKDVGPGVITEKQQTQLAPPREKGEDPLDRRVSFNEKDLEKAAASDPTDGITSQQPQDSQDSNTPSSDRTRDLEAGPDSIEIQRRPGLMREYTKLANKEAHPWQHWGITLGLPAIVLFDIMVPCIIYYVWWNGQVRWWHDQCDVYWSQGQDCPIAAPAQFNSDILGSAIASFGVGELWILIARVYRLFVHRDQCAPLLSRNKWELDATSWVYGVAMICALIPFVVGSALVMPKLYLYSPACLMGFLGLLMLITTFVPFKIPVGINSHPRGSGLRPFIYYAAEDFIAVDGLQDREFRIRFNRRYDRNASFRRFFVYLTLFWQLGVLTYIGCVSAVIWKCEFHVAFGLSLGVLFGYIAVWAGITFLWVNIEMKKERYAYEHSSD